MAKYDFNSPRLHVDAPLHAGAAIKLDPGQANYLGNVLRLKAGAAVLLFNGRDGEWRGIVTPAGKRDLAVTAAELTRAQPAPADLRVLFAPLKHARLDYMVQKAVEMGSSRLMPVITQHTQVARVNLERMRANAIEAAEQCGILSLPEIDEPVAFKTVIANLGSDRVLVFCDEEAETKDPVAALKAAPSSLGVSVLLGPEGGFSAGEREALLKLKNVVRLSLGPRVLRADTAAVAALALVQSVLGDWSAPSA